MLLFCVKSFYGIYFFSMSRLLFRASYLFCYVLLLLTLMPFFCIGILGRGPRGVSVVCFGPVRLTFYFGASFTYVLWSGF